MVVSVLTSGDYTIVNKNNALNAYLPNADNNQPVEGNYSDGSDKFTVLIFLCSSLRCLC